MGLEERDQKNVPNIRQFSPLRSITAKGDPALPQQGLLCKHREALADVGGLGQTEQDLSRRKVFPCMNTTSAPQTDLEDSFAPPPWQRDGLSPAASWRHQPPQLPSALLQAPKPAGFGASQNLLSFFQGSTASF